MKIIKQNSNKHTYKCPECGSIIEIQDSEFQVVKVMPPFPHLMGLADFQNDMRIKIRVCDCPVCGADIIKESCKVMKTDKSQTPGKTYKIKIISKRDGSILDTLVCDYNADAFLAEDMIIANYCKTHGINRLDILVEKEY